MIVSYKGPDTKNQKVLLEGFHEGEIEGEKVEEKKTAVVKPEEKKKAEEKTTGKLEGQFEGGFKASYFFFNSGTNQQGYKTDGKRADIVKSTKNINFKNDHAFKSEGKDFPNDHFACEWEGKIAVEAAGKYTFYTRSDDGSRLWINGKQVVDNWGLHGAREKKGVVELPRGYHDFKATHFENAGGASMIVNW